MTDRELLQAGIRAAGSTRKLAALLGRNARTVFAWKARADLALSPAVHGRLRIIVAVHGYDPTFLKRASVKVRK